MRSRIICVAAFLILILFCACTNTNQPAEHSEVQTVPSNKTTEPAIIPIETTQKEDNDAIYHLEYTQFLLPDPDGCATAQELMDDKIIIAEQVTNGVKLFWSPLDGENRELPLPDDAEYVYAVCSENDGFWLLYGSFPAAYRNYAGDVMINESPVGRVSIAYYNQDGEIESTFSLQTSYTGNNDRFTQLLIINDNFYLLGPELLVCVDETGLETARVENRIADGWRFAAVQMCEDKLYVLALESFSGAGDMLWEYDPVTLAQTNSYQLTEETIHGLGKAEDGRLLINGTDTIQVFDPSSEQKETLLYWDEMGVEITGEQMQTTKDGYIFYSPNEKIIETLFWTPGEQSVKKVLTMAVITSDIISENIGTMVQAFNLSQNEYQIKYTIYSDMPNDNEQEIDILRTQIMAGSAPDIFCFCSSGSSVELPIAPENVCVDILSELNTDTEIMQDSIVPGILNALTVNEKLYELPLSFTINTFIAPAALIAEPSITLQELDGIREQAGDEWSTFESWNTADNLLALSAPFFLGKYIDKENGICNFQTQEFYDYLAWCKTWGGSGAISDTSERTILRYKQIMNFEFLVGLSERAAKWFESQGYTYVGVPNETCNGSTYCLTSSLGISNQCQDFDGAWSFLEFCFDYMGENSVTLPANNEKLHTRMNLYIAGKMTDWRGEIAVISNTDAEQFYDLLSRITILQRSDDALMQILYDEATQYFAGQGSVEQAAKNIQNRASLYLAEQHN